MSVKDLGLVKSKMLKTICKNCFHELLYTPNDVHSYNGTDISGGPDGQEWINCPNCKKRSILRSW